MRDHTHHHVHIDVAMHQPVANVILDKIDGDSLARTDHEIVLIAVVGEPAMAMNVKQVDSVAQRKHQDTKERGDQRREPLDQAFSPTSGLRFQQSSSLRSSLFS